MQTETGAGIGECHELHLNRTPIVHATILAYGIIGIGHQVCHLSQDVATGKVLHCSHALFRRSTVAHWERSSPCIERGSQVAQLAPLWNEPSKFMLNFMVFTRVRINFQNGLELITYDPCRKCPTKRKFFSQAFPQCVLHKTVESRGVFLAPTSANIPWASLVSLKDRIVKGTRAGRRPNVATGNIQWRTLAFGAQETNTHNDKQDKA